MPKTFRTYLPNRVCYYLQAFVSGCQNDHLAYFVSDVVDQLDLSAIESVYEEEDRGQPPYHPGMMTKILLYGYCGGIFVAEDPEAIGGGRRFPSIGSG